MTNIIFNPTYEEEVTPQEYIRLYERDRDEIKDVRVIPPQLGSSGFGKIIVTHRTPTFTGLNGQPQFAREIIATGE